MRQYGTEGELVENNNDIAELPERLDLLQVGAHALKVDVGTIAEGLRQVREDLHGVQALMEGILVTVEAQRTTLESTAKAVAGVTDGAFTVTKKLQVGRGTALALGAVTVLNILLSGYQLLSS